MIHLLGSGEESVWFIIHSHLYRRFNQAKCDMQKQKKVNFVPKMTKITCIPVAISAQF